MTISFELPPEQEAVLRESARRLNLPLESLVAAAVRDFLDQASTSFEAAAQRVLRKNEELYRRLA